MNCARRVLPMVVAEQFPYIAMYVPRDTLQKRMCLFSGFQADRLRARRQM
jgi:hypothetical protein